MYLLQVFSVKIALNISVWGGMALVNLVTNMSFHKKSRINVHYFPINDTMKKNLNILQVGFYTSWFF